MVKNFLEDEIREAVLRMYPKELVPHFVVEPHSSGHDGADYATNIALVLAPVVKENPRAVAQTLQETLLSRKTFTEAVSQVVVAGPGFLNFTLSSILLLEGVRELEENLKNGFSFLTNTKINIEFISANPTGKLHIGHGRGAFFGDVLANVFAESDASVVREFYINDSRESKQISELGKTALGEGEQYKTPSLEEKINNLDTSGLDRKEAGFQLAKQVQKENSSFVENELGVHFDTFYSEDEHLRLGGGVENMKKRLVEGGFTYERDGAVWLKTSEYGDDEDRVLVRSDGGASYFLGDIAYHEDKFSRGLDFVFNIWGADHGGHVKRMEAVKKMLQWQGVFHVFIAQMVMLKGKDGEHAKMSKRAGNVVLLEDLVEEVGIDVVRWFFLEKALGTQMDFNLELAREQSEKNPVRYVQYAHARMCSILRKIDDVSPDSKPAKLSSILKAPSARALVGKLLNFPEMLETITKEYSVHKLTTYAHELSGAFSSFYHDVRVIEKDEKVNEEALELVLLTKETLAKSLGLLGITAPEKM